MTFDLATVQTTVQIQPPRVIIHGPPGIGKSTFAAGAPGCFFIDIEQGLDAISVPRATAGTVQEVLDIIGALYTEEHNYHTLAVDSIDWLEQVVFNQVAAEAGKSSIAEIGYGAGYKTAQNVIRQILEGMNALRRDRGMAIILIAHTQIKRFDDPVRESYDRYQLKLHDQCGEPIKEWADVVLFATQETFVISKEKRFDKSVNKAVSGDRVMFTENQPAYLAKNRYGLPSQLPLKWDSFIEAFVAATQKGEVENGKS